MPVPLSCCSLVAIKPLTLLRRTDVPYVVTESLSGAEPTYRTSLQKVSRVPNRRTVRRYRKSLGCRTDVPYVVTESLSGAELTYRTSLQKVSRVPNRRTVRRYRKSLGCRTDVPYVVTKSLSGAEPTYRTSLRKSFFKFLRKNISRPCVSKTLNPLP